MRAKTTTTDPRGAFLRARNEMRETLLLDGFSLPLEPETRQPGLARVICAYCAESAYHLEDIRHEPWCIYVDGPVCFDVPN